MILCTSICIWLNSPKFGCFLCYTPYRIQLSQWGSKALGDQGYTAIEILRNYYGDSIYINSTDEISGIPSSYPGSPLRVGDSGEKVRQMQRQLNVISNAYPLIPKIAEDGVFGPATEEAVKTFQRIFGLTRMVLSDSARGIKFPKFMSV